MMNEKQKAYHRERMRRLNHDPSMREKQSAGRRVTQRRSSFRVPSEYEDWYFTLITKRETPAREAAILLGLELKERRYAKK